MPRILIAEDEVALARAMGETLTDAGHEVQLVHVGEKVRREFQAFGPQIVLLDVRLGGVHGLDLLDQIKREAPETQAVVVTAYGSVELAVDAMKRGAAEFLTKPVDLDVLTVTIDRIWTASEDRRRLAQYRLAQAEQLRGVEFIGDCAPIRNVRRQIDRLAQRSLAAGGELPAILITGETGTGKDLLASYIHASLPHRRGPFVALNCSAVPAELFESELFGHGRGAFSGATEDKPGLIEAADGGTLFLDEIGDLPLAMQPKLLRALETHTLRRVGETRDRSFDVILITATNRNLTARVAEGTFRDDLYYRLKVVHIDLPPLRERGEDILRLTDRFCQSLGAKYGLETLTLTPKARERLRHAVWPGNVRELRHALESAALSIAGHTIDADDLPLVHRTDPVRRAENTLESNQPIDLDEVEKALIQRALHQTEGNVSAAARLLSIGREALRYRMSKFGLTGNSTDAEPDRSG